MSKTPKYDAKIKEILDVLEPGERDCELTNEKWEMTNEEISWYKKFNVPPSRRSPETRLKILSCFFTNFQWWWHKHPETDKPVLSGYNPNSGIKAIPDKEWFDNDYSSFGREYDSAKSFIEQLRKLELDVPFNASRNIEEPENSICLTSLGDVNSYFVMACSMKNGFFSIDAFRCEDSMLVAYGHHVTGSYDILHSERLHDCRTVRHSRDCVQSSFLFDCRRCENCFGATNKRNKKFLFFNEQLTENEWRERVAQIDLSKRSVFEEYSQRFQELVKDSVWPENFNEKAEGSTGEYLTNVTDVKNSYFGLNSGPNVYCCTHTIDNSEDVAFSSSCIGSSRCYNSCIMKGSNIKFSYNMIQCQDMEYSMNCFNCEFCFGCIGLQRKKFHIFNKEYSEEEYWQRVDELKCAMLERGEYGEFFPANFSGSGAPAFFGCGEKEAKQLGVDEYDPNANGASGFAEFDPETGKTVEQIPDALDDFGAEEWAGKPVFDPDKNRQFAFLKPEIEWYHKKRIAPPNKHFITRLLDIQKEMNTAVFEDASCSKCDSAIRIGKNFTYPDRKVYCRECYLKYLETNG